MEGRTPMGGKIGRKDADAGRPTLGSLFDGAGGFPLAGLMAGLAPVWASEIEPFPIRVTTRRLPQMRHLGDIRGIDGRVAEPVDVITFGSPCQDLSVAGRREGLAGERSGLFREAIRIVREMREATNGRKPEFIVWENVPGAFSSNGGEDFRTVLEEIVRIRDGNASVPRPDGGKWLPAGEIVGNGYSLAWRTYDAQYWGVPQRRRRIYLVADFAGRRAGYVQFERESLCGDIAPCGGKGQGAAGNPPQGAGSPSWAIQGNMINRKGNNGPHGSGINENVCFTLNTADRHAVAYGISSAGSNAWKSGNPHSGFYVAKAAKTIDTSGGNPVCAQGGNIVVQKARVYENHGQDGRCREFGAIGETVAAKYGTGGNSTPIVVEARPYSIGNGQAHSLGLGERARALDCMHDPQIVIEPQEGPESPYRARRLTPLECCRLQGFPDWWCDGLETESPTEGDIAFWRGVFEARRKALGKAGRPMPDGRIAKWLRDPRSDSAEYRMWGNSLVIPCAYSVLAGIAGVLAERHGDRPNNAK